MGFVWNWEISSGSFKETSVTFIILLNYLKLIYLVVAYGLAYLTIAPEILPYVTPSFTDFWLLKLYNL